MATTSETVITSVKLASALHKRVEILASARQQTPDSLMTEAIEQYLERREKREQFLKDGVASWEDYKSTGLHITGNEVDAWLDRLDAGDNAELPECHL
jgi:predicted transcriptional regulator